MELKLIKTEKCPICGCEEIIEESVKKNRIFDYKDERRKFQCGYTLDSFYNRYGEVVVPCGNRPEKLAWENSKNKLLEDLVDFMKKEEYNLNEPEIESLIRKVEWEYTYNVSVKEIE